MTKLVFSHKDGQTIFYYYINRSNLPKDDMNFLNSECNPFELFWLKFMGIE